MWLKLLLIPILIYGVILTVVYFAQTGLMFPTRMIPPAQPLSAGAERLELSAPNGDRLYGTYIPAVVTDEASPIILGFGGNAWNADEVARFLHGLYPEANVVAFHYRGYAPSEGRPSAATLLQDGPLIYDFVETRFGKGPVVAMGFSIGAGVAAALLARRPLEGAILVSPFDSLTAVASDHYPWLPVGLLLRHRMDPAEELRTVQAPVALITGEHDTIIRAPRAEALRRAIPNLVSFQTIGGAGHNDIYNMPAFHDAMRQALADILSRPDGSAALVPL